MRRVTVLAVVLVAAFGATAYAASVPRGDSAAKKHDKKAAPSEANQDTALFKKLFAQAESAVNEATHIATYLVDHIVPYANHANTADHATRADAATHAGTADSAGTAGNATGLAGPLASGQTERGEWAAFGSAGTFGEGVTLQIPLSHSLDAAHAQYVQKGAPTTGCPGSPESPQAASGYLCVYEQTQSAIAQGVFQAGGGVAVSGADPFGFFVQFYAISSTSYAYGTWAVTG